MHELDNLELPSPPPRHRWVIYKSEEYWSRDLCLSLEYQNQKDLLENKKADWRINRNLGEKIDLANPSETLSYHLNELANTILSNFEDASVVGYNLDILTKLSIFSK